MIEKNYTAATEYARLCKYRDGPLKRAREASKLTIPFLMPEEGHTSSSEFIKLFQNIGARGVNNLASKLLTSLLPPNTPFFKLNIDKFELEDAKAEAGEASEDLETELNRALGLIEQAVVSEVETSAIREHMYEALRQLIVCGNVLLYIPQDDNEDLNMRVYRMDSYVILRDPDGLPRRIIIRESISRDDVPEEIDLEIGSECPSSDKEGEDIFMYTSLVRTTNWETYQEINGQKVPDSEGAYKANECPYIPARFNKIDGESWGEAFVTEYIGDLLTYETLREAIVQAAGGSSKLVFLVNPNGTVSVKELNEAQSGDFVAGLPDDISTLQADKYADLQTAKDVMMTIGEDLAKSFLLNTSIQRSGERVTAEEIRYMAQELENGVGGVHSNLSGGISNPLASLLMRRMRKQGRLPELPKGLVKTQIVTGIDAIGRGHDLQNLKIFMSEAQALLGPQEVVRRTNVDVLLTRLATSLGVDREGLIKNPQEVEQQLQQERMGNVTENVAPEVVRQAASAIQNRQQ